MTKAQEKAAQVAANKKAAWFKKLQTLTGQVFGRIDRKAAEAAYESGITAEAHAAFVASLEPVGKVIHPMKAEAVKHASDAARATVAKVKADLEANGWDINKAAPYDRRASSWDTRNETAKSKNRFYSSLTKDAPGHRAPNYFAKDEPHIVVMADDMVERYVEMRERSAALDYDAFIVKMVGKVGDVETAAITGSHIWGHSILTITKRDGAEVFGERWKTQQIVNFSKFGEAFYQWPSRKMK